MENTFSIVDDVTVYAKVCLLSRCFKMGCITPLFHRCSTRTTQKTQFHLLVRNLATDCLPRICLRGNLFTNKLPSNGSTSNNILRKVQVIKLLIIQFFSTHYYFIPFGSKYSDHPVLKSLKSIFFQLCQRLSFMPIQNHSCDMTPCSFTGRYQRFGVTFVATYQITRCHISKDQNLNCHHCENLKSHLWKKNGQTIHHSVWNITDLSMLQIIRGRHVRFAVCLFAILWSAY
jgi:hypothetical protein